MRSGSDDRDDNDNATDDAGFLRTEKEDEDGDVGDDESPATATAKTMMATTFPTTLVLPGSTTTATLTTPTTTEMMTMTAQPTAPEPSWLTPMSMATTVTTASPTPSLPHRSAQTTEISLTTLSQAMLSEKKTKPTRLTG